MSTFSKIDYEEHPWKMTIDSSYISKRQLQKILPTYESAVPALLKTVDFGVPKKISNAINDLLVLMSRFDALQSTKNFNFPAMLLRSESSASSQIEHLSSSVRNIALAEVTEKAPKNAQLIAGNVSAMEKALNIEDEISKKSILKIHKALMEPTGESFGGVIRSEQVWVGGSGYSPHGAIFVPPHQSRVEEFLDDLIEYAKRDDINPIVKVAIFHAQFETIHPFIDGNGRTGRALLHKILKDENVLLTVTLPISAGLLHNISAYMNAIREYQNGNPLEIIEQIIAALELAITIGTTATNELEKVVRNWEERITDKKTASIWRLVRLLAWQPVVDAKYISNYLKITERASRDLLAKAENYEILRRLGNEKRGVFYQANEILSVMEEVSNVQNIRRLL